ncbi:MAG: CotH kinase family protein [Dysgonamonadaceae bacterium]|nr:CotH kinase family protein [Dysgonamonadaceae bacterium]
MFAVIAHNAVSQLKINEIMANNVSAVMDDSYNYSMWVELYNAGANTVNQSSYYLSDKLNKPRKWKPAGKQIAAGGFSTLWFEREDISGHASFKLKPKGGSLYLFDTSGVLIDSVNYPAQHRNTSYGRKTDGGGEWTFFIEHSYNASNNARKTANAVCAKPQFAGRGGFYSGTVNLSFDAPPSGETIYYTTDASEPSVNSHKYVLGSAITLDRTTCVRAIAVADNKLSSDIVTATYFVNERPFDLPVVSIVTDNKNLYDNLYGIYTVGTNGIKHPVQSCSNITANWFRDWDRPANFEIFDLSGRQVICQELDIAISGQCSRNQPQKGFKISPRNKFGDNQLRYDIFSSKPGREYKDIQLRASGSEAGCSMMRDGLAQTITIGMNQDYLAYEPAVFFLNGQYWGIQNLRERSSKDYLFTNYGLGEDDIILLDVTELADNVDFSQTHSFIMNNDIRNAGVYQQACEMIDIENHMDYIMAEIYSSNWDWTANNLKAWKKKSGGKWRWILFDLDMTFGYYDNIARQSLGVLANGGNWPNQSSMKFSDIFNRLIQNETYKKQFIARFCKHLSTRFSPERVKSVIDSLSSRIAGEMIYHKQRWPNSECTFSGAVNTMKNFANRRAGEEMNDIRSFFGLNSVQHTLAWSSNTGKATFQLLDMPMKEDAVSMKYFKGLPVTLEADDVEGYEFKHWLVFEGGNMLTVTPENSVWKYWDGNAEPSAAWKTAGYNDSSWKSGQAQLGYGNKGEVTTIDYGGDYNHKYTTAYFRQTVTINNLSVKHNFSIDASIDDGAVFYINGTEVYRYNMPDGAIGFNTEASGYGEDGKVFTFDIPETVFVEGTNLIAVEVHQKGAASSDLVFKLSLSCTEENSSGGNTVMARKYETVMSGDITIKAVYERKSNSQKLLDETSGEQKLSAVFYPNPVKNNQLNVVVEGAEGTVEASIYSIYGAKYTTQTFDEHKFALDISKCPAGILQVRLSTGNDYIVRKIIKL